MASVPEGDCHKDPNFAVICSFLDKYGTDLGLEPISYTDLQSYLEETEDEVSRVLIDIHIRLLRRIGKSIANSDRFEKSIIKFCHHFSEFDAWEVESYGYKHAKLGTKLRILKNLLESQFDYNLKFKEKINGQSAEEMRLLPVGRDKEGQAYWYFLDQDMNLLVYKEEQDDEDADTWTLICSNRTELANLVSNLQKECVQEEENKASVCETSSSKDGSPDSEELVKDILVKEEKKDDSKETGTKDCLKKDMTLSETGKDGNEEVVKNEQKNFNTTIESKKEDNVEKKMLETVKEEDINEKQENIVKPESSQDLAASVRDVKTTKEKLTKSRNRKCNKLNSGVLQKVTNDISNSPAVVSSELDCTNRLEEVIECKVASETSMCVIGCTDTAESSCDVLTQKRPKLCEKKVDCHSGSQVTNKADVSSSDAVPSGIDNVKGTVDSHENDVNCAEDISASSHTSLDCLEKSISGSHEEINGEISQDKKSDSLTGSHLADSSVISRVKIKQTAQENVNKERYPHDSGSQLQNPTTMSEDNKEVKEPQIFREIEGNHRLVVKNSMQQTTSIQQLEMSFQDEAGNTDRPVNQDEQNASKIVDSVCKEDKNAVNAASTTLGIIQKSSVTVDESSSQESDNIKEPPKYELPQEVALKSFDLPNNLQTITESHSSVQTLPSHMPEKFGDIKSKLDTSDVMAISSEGQEGKHADVNSSKLRDAAEQKHASSSQQVQSDVITDINSGQVKQTDKSSGQQTQSVKQADVSCENLTNAAEQTSFSTAQQEQLTEQSSANSDQQGQSAEQTDVSCGQQGQSAEQTDVSSGQHGQSTDQTGVSSGQQGQSAEKTNVSCGQQGQLTEQISAGSCQRGQSGEQTSVSSGQQGPSAEQTDVSSVQLEQSAEKYQVTPSQKGQSAEQNDVTSGQQGQLAEQSDVTSGQQEHSAEPSDETSGWDKKSAEQTDVKSDQQRLSTEQTDVVSCGQQGMLSEQSYMITGREEQSVEPNDVTSGREEQSVELSDVTSGREEQSVKPSDVTSGREEQSVEPGDVSSGREEQSVEPSDVTSGREEQSVEPSDVTSGREEQSVKPSDLSFDQQGQSTEKNEVSPSQQGHSAEQSDVGSGQHGQSIEETDMSSGQQKITVSSGQQEPSAEKNEVRPSHQGQVAEQTEVSLGQLEQSAEQNDISSGQQGQSTEQTERSGQQEQLSEQSDGNSGRQQTDVNTGQQEQSAEQTGVNSDQQEQAADKTDLCSDQEEHFDESDISTDQQGQLLEQTNLSSGQQRQAAEKNETCLGKQEESHHKTDISSLPQTSGVVLCPNESVNKDNGDNLSSTNEIKSKDTGQPVLATLASDASSAVLKKDTIPETVSCKKTDGGFSENKPEIETFNEPEDTLRKVESKNDTVVIENFNGSTEEKSAKFTTDTHTDAENSCTNVNENTSGEVAETVKQSLPVSDCTKKSQRKTDEFINSASAGDNSHRIISDKLDKNTVESNNHDNKTNNYVDPAAELNNEQLGVLDKVEKVNKQDGCKSSIQNPAETISEPLESNINKATELTEVFSEQNENSNPQVNEVTECSKPQLPETVSRISEISQAMNYETDTVSHTEDEAASGSERVKPEAELPLQTSENKNLLDNTAVNGSIESEILAKGLGKAGKRAKKGGKKQGRKRATNKKAKTQQILLPEQDQTATRVADALSKNVELQEEAYVNNEEPSKRKLKRSVPEPGSDEPLDSEPNGKRAKQATKTQKTRSTRNAAARGRSARLPSKNSESEDSETPLSQVRDRCKGLARGSGRKAARGRSSKVQQVKPNQDSTVEDEGEEEATGKRGKKKKPDSDSETLSEAEATPAKKGRNQTQPAATKSKPTALKNVKVEKTAVVEKAETPVAVPAAVEDAGVRRSVRVKQLRARRPPTPSSPSEETEITTEEGDTTEEEGFDKNFLDESFTPEEESGDEEFKPKGRNFQRQAARTNKEETVEVINDDTPCVKCGKYDHPEMILLCDKCDAGYHTACLRPPLMIIPDGDWFCPPCEHSKLVEKLVECLQSLDQSQKKRERLSKRQERLAFVGISISNILQGGRKVVPSVKYRFHDQALTKGDFDDSQIKEEYEALPQEYSAGSSNESEPEPKRVFRSERLAMRQAEKRSRREKHRSRPKPKQEVEVLTQRACRTRGSVSYQFKEFDELISSAIADDKPCRREKPPGISRGKDMSNILGASDEEDEKIRQRDGDSGRPPPVLKKKPRRKLTRLDSDDDPEDDDSEEFKLSEEEETEASEDEGDVEEEGSGSSDSGDWKPRKTWYNSHTSGRSARKSRRLGDNEDDDYNSDENAVKRRSTRNSNRGRIHYCSWGSDETEEASVSGSESSGYVASRFQKKNLSKNKKFSIGRRKGKTHRSNSDSDSSLSAKRKNLRRLIKKRRKDDSETEESDKMAKSITSTQKKKQGKLDSEESDFVADESLEDSDDAPRFKKKNVLRSSDDEDEDEGSEKEGKTVGEKDESETTEAATAGHDSQSLATLPSVSKPSEVVPDDSGRKSSVVVAGGTDTKSSDVTSSNLTIEVKPLTQKQEYSSKFVSMVIKGKKRTDIHIDDKVTVVLTDIAIPGKIRKVSGCDQDLTKRVKLLPPEVNVVAKVQPEVETCPPVNTEKLEDTQSVTKDQEENIVVRKKEVLSSKIDHQKPAAILPQQARVKPADSRRKKTVPNFLDVNSGEDSDEQKQGKEERSSLPPFEGEAPKVQPVRMHVLPVTKTEPMDEPQQHSDFPQQERIHDHMTVYKPRAPPYAHSQMPTMPYNVRPIQHDTKSPSHTSDMSSVNARNGPPGLVSAFADSVPRHPHPIGSSIPGAMTAPPRSFAGRGPRPRSEPPFPPGMAQHSRTARPGVSVPTPNPEHRGSRPVFQGMPHGQSESARGQHMPSRGIQQQPHGGAMQPQYFMGHQRPAHQNTHSDAGSRMQGYMPSGYGNRQIVPAHDIGQNSTRHPYSHPPPSSHSMGQHFNQQYPVSMGSSTHNMNSPLTSMGQMTKNLASVGSLHSPPRTHMVGNSEAYRERPASMETSPNKESTRIHEGAVGMVPIVKTENTDDEFGEGKKGKVGKKRVAPGKQKKKVPDSQALLPVGTDLSNHVSQAGTAEGHKRIENQGPYMGEGHNRFQQQGPYTGAYRPGNQPYGMPQYPTPFSHPSMPHLSNTQPGARPFSGPPGHGPRVVGDEARIDPKDIKSEAKWDGGMGKADHKQHVVANMSPGSMTTQPHISTASSVSDYKLKMSHQQSFSQSQLTSQSVPVHARRQSHSPIQQMGAEAQACEQARELPLREQSMRSHVSVTESRPYMKGPLPAHMSAPSTTPQDGNSRSAGQMVSSGGRDHSVHPGIHGHSMAPGTRPHGPRMSSPESQGSFYPPPSAHYPHFNPHYSQTMPHNNNNNNNNAWSSDMRYGPPRFGPQSYPYSMNPMGYRMSQARPGCGTSQNHSISESPTKSTSVLGHAGIKDDSSKTHPVEDKEPFRSRRPSTEHPTATTLEPGQIHPKTELDVKPVIKHSELQDSMPPREILRPHQPPALPETTPPCSSSTTTPSATPHSASEVVTSKPPLSVELSTFQHSATSSVMQPYQQVSPTVSMAPQNSWPRPSPSGQWGVAGVGNLPSYNMNRPYGAPASIPYTPYGMDSQSRHMRPHAGQGDPKNFMHQGYDPRFQPPHTAAAAATISESNYQPPAYNQDYHSSSQYPPHFQNRAPNPDVKPELGGHYSDPNDSMTDLNTVSKPKRAKTQKKTAKDSGMALRGKPGKGRGRGRGGFMIDNLLHPRGVEADEEVGEDNAEMNEIVNYVTSDEYFKSGSFARDNQSGNAAK